MTVVELPRPFASADVASAMMSWWDPDAECTVKIARPSYDDALWREYLAGAERSYRKHGVSAAIDIDAIRDAADTTVFWTMLDSAGTVLGGVRAVGPLTSADDSHAVVEWAGQPSLPQVRKMITDRLPFGVVEMKSDDPRFFDTLKDAEALCIRTYTRVNDALLDRNPGSGFLWLHSCDDPALALGQAAHPGRVFGRHDQHGAECRRRVCHDRWTWSFRRSSTTSPIRSPRFT